MKGGEATMSREPLRGDPASPVPGKECLAGVFLPRNIVMKLYSFMVMKLYTYADMDIM